jgi:hypothetical protein
MSAAAARFIATIASTRSRFRSLAAIAFAPSAREAVEQWLARQRAKLLPVDYYLITFTLLF